MPISVSCSCGKTFRVRDELAGRQVTCQVCGATLEVGAAPPTVAAVPMSGARGTVSSPPGADTMACPACAETISRQARFCPACGETVRARLTAEEQQQLLQAAETALASHRPAFDEALRGRFPTVKTWIAGAATFLCLVSLIYGLSGQGREAATVLGVMFGLIFGIALIVSLVNDYGAHHIQDAASPDAAYQRFFNALKTGRTGTAFAALAPSARKVASAESMKFNNPKIPHQPTSLGFSDPSGYAAYWKQIFKGPRSHTRTVKLKRVRVLARRADGVAVVEATFAVTSYNSWLLALIFLNIIICAIAIQLAQAKDEVVIRKALVRRRERWFLLEGSCQGELDRALQ